MTPPSNPSVEETYAGTELGTQRGSAPRQRLGPGEAVGRYVILRELGRGAMGVVYAAYDPQLDRQIALKLVSAAEGALPDASTRARLVGEAQAMARLTHPNVVAVHDAGEHGDGVFIAMEFIDGLTVKEWIARATPDWRDVLKVYVWAGRGLAALHAADLLHRDFKPGNVMVDVDPDGAATRARVLDFGLALAASTARSADPSDSAVERWSMGEQTRMAGTPAYMAPEHHAGYAPGPRADQFSFCVSLWESLHGQHPFAGGSVSEFVGRIASGTIHEPPRSSAVPSWLQSVLRRGLARDPDDRWRSMQDLLEAIEHGQSRRRRRARVVTGLGAMIVVASTWGLVKVRESQARSRCQAEADVIEAVWNEAARDRLHAGFAALDRDFVTTAGIRTASWIDAYAQEWSQTWNAGCQAAEVDGTLASSTWTLEQACLLDRQAELEALLQMLDRPTLDLATVATKRAAALPSISVCTDPARLRRWRNLPDTPELRASIADVRARLRRAELSLVAGENEQAQALAQAAHADAEATQWGPLRADALDILALVDAEQGNYEAAYEKLEQAFLLAGAAGDDERMATLAASLVNIAGSRLARIEQGEHWGDLSAMLLERIGARDSELAQVHHLRMGILLETAGRYDEAAQHHRRALEISERHYGPDGPASIAARHNLGTIAFRRNDLPEARRLWQGAVEAKVRVLGPDHPSTAVSLVTLGNTHAYVGEHEQAIELYERALDIQKRALGRTHSKVGLTLTNLATAWTARGDNEKALQLYQEALDILEPIHGRGHPDVMRVLANMASEHITRQEWNEALELSEEIVQTLQRDFEPGHSLVAPALVLSGEALAGLGRLEEARARFEKLLKIKADTDISPRVRVRLLVGLGQTLVGLGVESDRAREYLRQAQELATDLGDDETAAELGRLRAELEPH